MDQSTMYDWFVIDPDYKGNDIGTRMWYAIYRHFVKNGLLNAFGISTNPVAAMLCSKFNGEIASRRHLLRRAMKIQLRCNPMEKLNSKPKPHFGKALIDCLRQLRLFVSIQPRSQYDIARIVCCIEML